MYQTVFFPLWEARMASTEPRRQAILEATIRVVGREGYRATSVAGVIAEARTSRSTFYKYFANKRGCFLAAYELATERVLGTALGSCEARPWPQGVGRGLTAVVELFSRDQELANTAVVEFAAAGVEARRRHWETLTRLARRLEESCPRRRPPLPPSTALMAVSGVAALIADELRGGRAGELPAFLPELEFALLVPFLGPSEAIATRRRYVA